MIVVDKSSLIHDLDTYSQWIGAMDKEGFGGKPCQRYVVRLPHHDIYVTVKSVVRLKNTNTSHIKLYKLGRLRIGDVNGYIGESMLHGQYPGKNIYIAGQRYPDADEYCMNTI